MNVAVLGTGYVGSAYVRAMHYLGFYPRVLSRSWFNYYDPRELKLYLKIQGVRLLINAAGFTGNTVDDCQAPGHRQECYDSNVVLPRTAAGVCKELGIGLVHISSGCVFNSNWMYFTEQDAPNFTTNFYQQCKLSAEQDVLESGARAWIFRIRMPFSHRYHPRNWLIKLCQHEQILDGLNSVTFLDEFCIRSLLLVTEKAASPGIYHAAGSPVRTVDVAEQLVRAGLRKMPIKVWDPRLFLSEHVARSEAILVSHKFEDAFGTPFGQSEAALIWAIDQLGRPPASLM